MKCVKEWKGRETSLGGPTKANWELNSPAAIQAALIIPWKAWAENDATEGCQRATALSWGRPTMEDKHVRPSPKSSLWEQRKPLSMNVVKMEGEQRALFHLWCVGFTTWGITVWTSSGAAWMWILGQGAVFVGERETWCEWALWV